MLLGEKYYPALQRPHVQLVSDPITRVTDTSSGFRAMRTEVTQTVPQLQVQYQTSELLIGAIYAGYRIAERPITMHQRLA